MWLLEKEHPGRRTAGAGRSGGLGGGRREGEQVNGCSRRASRGMAEPHLVGPGFGRRNGGRREEI